MNWCCHHHFWLTFGLGGKLVFGFSLVERRLQMVSFVMDSQLSNMFYLGPQKTIRGVYQSMVLDGLL